MQNTTTDDSPVQLAEGKPGTYTVPTLRPITNPIRFATADTDLDGTPALYTCPACKNPDFECVCGGVA